MASTISKRQQARNEKTLQELLKQSGNDRCADCFTRNPGWASWSLGVFLCVRCASLHRKLGTHISKVKSLSMDAWSLEQVENMKKTGNLASNRRYNPKQQKPNIPIDADEVDGAMERFIREKYQHKTLCGEGRPLPSIKHHTGSSSGSSNDVPPPLPAKNAPRLTSNLRSSSAMYPQSSGSLPSPPASDFSSNGSRRMAGIPEDGPPSREQSFEGKLDSSRDLGSSSLARSATTNGISFEPSTTTQPENGVSFPTGAPQHAPSSSNSSNPFHRSVSTPIQQPQLPGNQSFEQSFQNMSISQQQSQPQQHQSLFPNNTGSWTTPGSSAVGTQNNPFLKTFTPPISPSPYHYQSAPPQQITSNPFLRPSQSQTFTPSNPFGGAYQTPNQTQQPSSVPNWPQQQPTSTPQSAFSGLPQQSQQLPQQAFQQQTVVQSPAPSDASALHHNPLLHHQQSPQSFFDMNQQQQQSTQAQQLYGYPQGYNDTQPQQLVYPHHQQAPHQQQFSQPRPFQDKNSILALYNTPNPYTQNAQQMQPQAQQQFAQSQQIQQQASPPVQPLQQRSVTMPIMSNGNSNPFMSSAAPQATQLPVAGSGHVSRESMAFTAGRSPSPDAFSGLSAAQWR